MRVSTLDRQYKISQSTPWLYPPPPSLPPPEFFLVLATKLTKKGRTLYLKWNLAELFGLWSTDFAKVVEFRIFSNIFVESRKSSQANKKQAYNCQTLASEILQPIKYSNISRKSHDNMVASSWCTAITSDYIYTFYSWLWYVRCTFSKTILYKRLTTIFSGAGRQFLIVVFLSFAGIVRGEEGVSLQSFGDRRPRCWKN